MRAAAAAAFESSPPRCRYGIPAAYRSLSPPPGEGGEHAPAPPGGDVPGGVAEKSRGQQRSASRSPRKAKYTPPGRESVSERRIASERRFRSPRVAVPVTLGGRGGTRDRGPRRMSAAPPDPRSAASVPFSPPSNTMTGRSPEMPSRQRAPGVPPGRARPSAQSCGKVSARRYSMAAALSPLSMPPDRGGGVRHGSRSSPGASARRARRCPHLRRRRARAQFRTRSLPEAAGERRYTAHSASPYFPGLPCRRGRKLPEVGGKTRLPRAGERKILRALVSPRRAVHDEHAGAHRCAKPQPGKRRVRGIGPRIQQHRLKAEDDRVRRGLPGAQAQPPQFARICARNGAAHLPEKIPALPCEERFPGGEAPAQRALSPRLLAALAGRRTPPLSAQSATPGASSHGVLALRYGMSVPHEARDIPFAVTSSRYAPFESAAPSGKKGSAPSPVRGAALPARSALPALPGTRRKSFPPAGIFSCKSPV